jgi:hypothetical protein
MACWQRITIGLAVFGLGSTMFLEIPLTRGRGALDALAHFGISLGALIAFMGLGVVIGASPEQ